MGYNEDIEIILETDELQIELTDYVTFWKDILGVPSSNTALVNYLNTLLAKKQDLIYYIVETETDKESISDKQTGTVVFVKATKNLYIYYAGDTTEWVLLTQDLSVYYTKDETDSLLSLKANITDVYSKIDADARFASILSLTSHTSNTSNPHQVTKAQVGLDNVENLKPADMPISTATQTALNAKQNIITGAVSNVVDTNLPANKVVVTNSQGKLATDENIDTSKLELLDGARSNIQEQIDSKENSFTKNTAFNKNFSDNISDLKMDGQASLGTSSQIPRADHVHPSDTTKLDKNASIAPATATKITYDSKGLVTGSSNLTKDDIPDLSGTYESKSNKTNTLTDTSYQYPTTHAVTEAISDKVEKDYVDQQVQTLNEEINNKENAFTKNTAFNKNFATTSQEIKMDGEAQSGTSTNVARADHVHPSDTSKENVANKTDQYDTSSPITYASSRALYNGLNTRLKPSDLIPGDHIAIMIDGTKAIINAIPEDQKVYWGDIEGVLKNQTDLQDALDDKQNTLISGTNIKTINHQSVLGSGNIQISVGNVNWGHIDGNIEDQTDLNNELTSINDKIKEIELFKFPNAIIFGNPTINQGQVSGFTTTSYLQFPFVVDVRNKNFEIDFCFTTSTDVTTKQSIMDSKYGLALGIENGKGIMSMSSNGTSWDIGTVTGTTSILPNTTYYAKVTWDGTTYKTALSTDGSTYTDDMTLTSSLGLYPTTIYIGGGSSTGLGRTPNPFNGSINFNKCYLYVAGLLVWQGMDDAGLATRADVSLSNLDSVGTAKITYTAGPGIDITNNVISNTQTSAEWGNITGTLSSQTDLQNALNNKQDNLPTFVSGRFLTNDGTNLSWSSVDALPSQSGQSGKYLTTNGTTASWATVTVPTITFVDWS